MNEWNVFGVIVAIFGFVATMYTMFYKPTHELKIEIVKLNANLSSLRDSDSNQNNRLDTHSVKIDTNTKNITRIDMEVQYLKKRVD